MDEQTKNLFQNDENLKKLRTVHLEEVVSILKRVHNRLALDKETPINPIELALHADDLSKGVAILMREAHLRNGDLLFALSQIQNRGGPGVPPPSSNAN